MLALVVALGIRGEGPLALGLGDADGAARLDGGGSATLGEPTPGVRETSPVVLPGGGVAASVAGPSGRRRAGALRGAADAHQAPAAATRAAPAGTRPVASPNAPTTTTTRPATTTRPTATSTPNPNAVKVRGRGHRRAQAAGQQAPRPAGRQRHAGAGAHAARPGPAARPSSTAAPRPPRPAHRLPARRR